MNRGEREAVRRSGENGVCVGGQMSRHRWYKCL